MNYKNLLFASVITTTLLSSCQSSEKTENSDAEVSITEETDATSISS